MKKSPLILLTLSAILSSCSNSPTPAPKKEAPFKNLILVIGDGMGLEHVAGAKLTSDQDYKFTTWNQAVSNTNSLGSVNGYPIYTTDSAASATAKATGEITLNGYIGKDRYARDKETIMDYAKSLGKSTAIVTTDVGYGATPAAFPHMPKIVIPILPLPLLKHNLAWILLCAKLRKRIPVLEIHLLKTAMKYLTTS